MKRSPIVRNILALSTAFFIPLAGFAKNSSKIEEIYIDPTKPAQNFPHFWEHTICYEKKNSGFKNLTAKDLKRCKQTFDVRHIRLAGLVSDVFANSNDALNDQPAKESGNKNPYEQCDKIFDMLVQLGIHPVLVVEPGPFTADSAHWNKFISDFAKHELERYGIAEVSLWHFEISDDQTSKREFNDHAYCQFFKDTTSRIKEANPLLKIGAQITNRKGKTEFITDFCAKNSLPIDFIEVEADRKEKSLAAQVQRVRDRIQSSSKPELPIFCNAVSWNTARSKKELFERVPRLASEIKNSSHTSSQITFVTLINDWQSGFDVHDCKPGLLEPDSNASQIFYMYKEFDLLGDEEIPVEPSFSPALATTKGGSLTLAVWNFDKNSSVKNRRKKRFQIKIKEAEKYAQGTCHTLQSTQENAPPDTELVSPENLEFEMQPNELRVIKFFPKARN